VTRPSDRFFATCEPCVGTFAAMKMPSLVVPSAVLTASLALGCGSPPPQAAPPATPSSVSASAAAEADDGLGKLTDEQLVHKLLDVTGVSGLGKQVADNMMESFRRMPNLPPGFVDRFKQNLRTETFVELIVPIYLKHYDRTTILAAIHFYQSEPGHKMVAALPAVTAESMEVGRKWGGDLAKKTLDDLGVARP